MATTVTAEEGPVIPRDSFGARLLLVRHHFSLSQAEAAERCGLDDGSWSNWERGSSPRDKEVVVRKISNALGVDRDWLMWGTPGCLTAGESSLAPQRFLANHAA